MVGLGRVRDRVRIRVRVRVGVRPAPRVVVDFWRGGKPRVRDRVRDRFRDGVREGVRGRVRDGVRMRGVASREEESERGDVGEGRAVLSE